jgi:MipA family protein
MNHLSPTFTVRRVTPIVVITLGMTVFGSSAALAQSDKTDNGAESQWSLGLGAVTIQKAYRDIESDNMAIPIINYENKWLSLSGAKLDIKLYSEQSLSFRLRGRYAGSDGYESSDSSFLVGMDERKSSFWAGGAVIWKSDIANVSAELLGDASGDSKGSRFKLLLDRRFGVGEFGLTPRVGVEWYDSKYVDYYYGVKASEARVGRSIYQGDSSTGIEAGLRVDYSPARQHNLFLDFGITQFGSAIKDSPLVEKSNQSMMSIGYIYRF